MEKMVINQSRRILLKNSCFYFSCRFLLTVGFSLSYSFYFIIFLNLNIAYLKIDFFKNVYGVAHFFRFKKIFCNSKKCGNILFNQQIKRNRNWNIVNQILLIDILNIFLRKSAAYALICYLLYHINLSNNISVRY